MSGELTIALAGNPNCGKSTLFNTLTGARQHVGNYPGVTVEKKTGTLLYDGWTIDVVDLPGTYSLTAYSEEERVARRFLVNERPDVVVCVVDASNLERNLYLVVQLLELGVPVLVALNMWDVAARRGMHIDVDRMSEHLGVPVVPTVAVTGEGVQDLLNQLIAVGREDIPWQPLVLPYRDEINIQLQGLEHRLQDEPELTRTCPARWLALKLLEDDGEARARVEAVARDAGALLQQGRQAHARLHEQLGADPLNVLSDERYLFIDDLTSDCVERRSTPGATLSDRIDQVVTHHWLGPPLVLTMIFLLYSFTFWLPEVELLGWLGVPGTLLSWTAGLFDGLAALAGAVLPDGLLQSLVVDGVIGGVGGVLGFVPLIALMFLGIALLEDSGYMARISFVMDRVLRKFGLHGSSVLSLVVSGGIAGGCAVPGVMAARTLKDKRERYATIFVCGMMNCGAKLPVYALLIAAFFQQYRAVVMFALTLLSWGTALVAAWLLRHTVLPGPRAPFMMELPPYRLPRLRDLLLHAWERIWMYIQKAGTVIVLASIVMWVLMTFPQPPAASSPQHNDLEYSLAGRAGKLIEPVFAPLGFDWRTDVALIGGLAAKEIIVSTLGTAYSLAGVEPGEYTSLSQLLADSPAWSPLKALALMVFIMLYSPCMATLAVIVRETDSWLWGLFGMVYPTLIAYVLALVIYQGGLLLGLG